MAPPYRSLKRAIVDVLRNSGISAIQWADTTAAIRNGSPWYVGVPDQAPAYPYCVYEMSPAGLDWKFEGVYEETFEVVIKVAGEEEELIDTLTAPEVKGSLCWYLDQMSKPPNSPGAYIYGPTFLAIDLTRQSYQLVEDTQRSPLGAYVWVATAPYRLTIRVNLNA